MINRPGRHLLYSMLALSLSACGPAPNTSPSTGPSAQPTNTPSTNPSNTPVSASSLHFRLVADPSLARFQTAQVDDFTLCLAQIASASTRFSFNGTLSATATAALRAAGATVESSGDSHVITFSSALTLAQLLAGVDLRLPEVPAGSIEGRTTFFNAANQEIGFVTWQATLSGGASDVTVTLSEAEGAANQVSNACPRLHASVSGATLRGAGGQLTGGGSTPSATPTPGSGSGASPTPSPNTAPGEAPSSPSNLQVVEQGQTYLTLQWDFPADARSFKLYLDGREVLANHVTPNYYRYEGLRASTNYMLGVRSVSPGGESPIVELRGTTLAEGGRNASGNFSSGGNGNTSSNNGVNLRAGDEFSIDSGTSFGEITPDIAMDADGNYVVIWNEFNNSYYAGDIFGQRFNRNHQPVGSEFLIYDRTSTTFVGASSHVAMDAEGNFVVTWSDGNAFFSESDVYAQLYDADAQAIGSAFLVNTYTSSVQFLPDVAMDDEGNFTISWSGFGQEGPGVYARQFDSEGQSPDPSLNSEFLVAQTSSSVFTSTAIAMDSDGDYVITYSPKYSGNETGVFAQRFDSDGTPQGGPLTVSEDSVFTLLGFSLGISPLSVSMDSEGAFVIAWPALEDGDNVIHARNYTRRGAPEGDEFVVANAGSSTVYASTAVSLDDDGNFIVSWASNPEGESGFGGIPRAISGRYYTGSDDPADDEFLIKAASNSGTTVLQLAPAIGMDEDGDFVVTWFGSPEQPESGTDLQVFIRPYEKD